MKQILAAGIAFAVSINCYTQEKFDSVAEYKKYEPSGQYYLTYSEGRKYNSNGKLIDQKRKMISPDNTQQFWTAYTYGPNDSLKTLSISVMQQGEWKLGELWEYTYDGGRLKQNKITGYALDESQKNSNVDKAAKRTVYYPGVYVVDVSGATTNGVINFEYDTLGRLIKKSEFLDPNYVKPSRIWQYYYDKKDIPDIFTKVEGRGLLWDMHYYLYKEGKLVKYRHDDYNYYGLDITSKTDEYSYTKQGLVDEVSSSEKKLKLYQAGKKFFYNVTEKERTWHTEKHNYQDGRLVSIDEKHLEGYKVTKRYLPDIDVSTSTYGAGSVYRTTTTTTVTQGGTYEVTKYKWNSESTSYTYTPEGKSQSIKSGGVVTEYTYDSKGRVVERKTTWPSKSDTNDLIEVKYVYWYR